MKKAFCFRWVWLQPIIGPSGLRLVTNRSNFRHKEAKKKEKATQVVTSLEGQLGT